MNIKNQIKIIALELFDTFEEMIPYRFLRKIVFFMSGILLITLFVGLFWWYSRYHQNAMYKDLTYLEIYLKGARDQNDVNWFLFEEQFIAEQASHSKAKDTGYLPLLHVEILLKQGKIDEARDLLADNIAHFVNSPLYSYIQSFYALVLIDGTQEQKNEGLGILEKIANAEDDLASDYAAYQVGYYYFVNRNFGKAKFFWHLIIDRSVMSEKKASVWAVKAEEKINQIP